LLIEPAGQHNKPLRLSPYLLLIYNWLQQFMTVH